MKRTGSPPSGPDACHPNEADCVAGGQTSVLDRGPGGDGGRQVDDGYVVRQDSRAHVVILML